MQKLTKGCMITYTSNVVFELPLIRLLCKPRPSDWFMKEKHQTSILFQTETSLGDIWLVFLEQKHTEPFGCNGVAWEGHI